MDNTTPQYVPDGMQAPLSPVPENKSSIGNIIGTIIIIAIIILGGLYFWGKRIEETQAEKSLTQDSMMNSYQANAVNTTSSSDSINAINADLKSTDTTSLGSELR